MALLSMALNAIDCPAISFTGSQSGIVTTISHNRAQIEEIRGARIAEALDEGRVVIVAGFQGVSRTREITTLGRGGSDTTAVAIAATLGARCCEIYSDYPGVFTADPRIVTDAKAIAHLSYDTAVELAARGARVLHYRAAELARRYRVPLVLKASFGDDGGTTIDDSKAMENATITSITSNTDIALVRARASSRGAVTDFLKQIADGGTRVVTLQRASVDSGEVLECIVDAADAGRLGDLLTRASDVDGTIVEDIAAVSLVGSGLTGTCELAAAIEACLKSDGIETLSLSYGPLAITALVARDRCEDATRLLHGALVDKA